MSEKNKRKPESVLKRLNWIWVKWLSKFNSWKLIRYDHKGLQRILNDLSKRLYETETNIIQAFEKYIKNASDTDNIPPVDIAELLKSIEDLETINIKLREENRVLENLVKDHMKGRTSQEQGEFNILQQLKEINGKLDQKFTEKVFKEIDLNATQKLEDTVEELRKCQATTEKNNEFHDHLDKNLIPLTETNLNESQILIKDVNDLIVLIKSLLGRVKGSGGFGGKEEDESEKGKEIVEVVKHPEIVKPETILRERKGPLYSDDLDYDTYCQFINGLKEGFLNPIIKRYRDHPSFHVVWKNTIDLKEDFDFEDPTLKDRWLFVSQENEMASKKAYFERNYIHWRVFTDIQQNLCYLRDLTNENQWLQDQNRVTKYDLASKFGRYSGLSYSEMQDHWLRANEFLRDTLGVELIDITLGSPFIEDRYDASSHTSKILDPDINRDLYKIVLIIPNESIFDIFKSGYQEAVSKDIISKPIIRTMNHLLKRDFS